MISRYGRLWNDYCSELTIELVAFSEGFTVENGGLGKAEHFWNCVNMLWGWEGCAAPVDRTPWAELMIEEACETNFLSVAGCASSGKSGVFALWGIVCFLADPANTKVLITSTSLKAAKKRIWGSVMKWWRALPEGIAPGKEVASLGTIQFIDEKGKAYDTQGLELIACEQKKEKEAVDKLIGFKSGKVILIADELPDLSEAILTASLANLTSNPSFQMVGLGNPSSFFDPFGIFSEPEDGWATWNRGMSRWRTKLGGLCIRLDAYESPNVIAGENVYKWMPDFQWVEDQKKRLGENSAMFWRMVRGCWSPTGAEDSIFSENDILVYGGNDHPMWRTPPRRLVGLDPSFTDGGDRCVLCVADLGETTDGLLVLHFTEFHNLYEDSTQDDPRNFQIAKQFRDFCVARKIAPRNAALDSTGGGGPFWDIVCSVWSAEVLPVGFGGAASKTRTVSDSDPVPCNIRYKNRVTQLWYSMVDLLRARQIKGITRDLAQELTSRRYETKKAPHHDRDEIGIQYTIEPKKDMKARVGSSPDLGDAAAVVTALAIERFQLMPGVSEATRRGEYNSWEQQVQNLDVLGNTPDSELIYGTN